MAHGLDGAIFTLIIGIALTLATCILGDKVLLFTLGAREISSKEKKISSLLRNISCLNSYEQIKVYSFHRKEIQACYIRSFFGQGSLILTDSLLNHNHSVEIISDILEKSELNRYQFIDISIMLVYQLATPGYIFSNFSKVLSTLFFYLLDPIINLRKSLTHFKVELGSGYLTFVSKTKKIKKKEFKLVTDIIQDFSIIEKKEDTLMSYFIK